jgi:glycosyltransferase involved in cell wall biosynthesis
VTHERQAGDLSRVALIVPALNEAESLALLLPQLSSHGLGQTLICDNGSTDETRAVIETHGGTWVFEPRRGYGAACYAGIEALAPMIEIVAFLDADLSDDPQRLPELVAPIASDECDFVIGVRVAHLQEAGSTTFPQRFANWMFPVLIKWGWGHSYTDLGPFRAVRRTALDQIGMQDRAFGWTMEMQIRAVELGLRIREIPVPYRKRRVGKGKISGTIRGVWLAAYWITRTCLGLWLTKGKRRRAATSRGRANVDHQG